MPALWCISIAFDLSISSECIRLLWEPKYLFLSTHVACLCYAAPLRIPAHVVIVRRRLSGVKEVIGRGCHGQSAQAHLRSRTSESSAKVRHCVLRSEAGGHNLIWALSGRAGLGNDDGKESRFRLFLTEKRTEVSAGLCRTRSLQPLDPLPTTLWSAKSPNRICQPAGVVLIICRRPTTVRRDSGRCFNALPTVILQGTPPYQLVNVQTVGCAAILSSEMKSQD